MARDIPQAKGCLFGYMAIIAILLFTTTSFLFLPFAGPGDTIRGHGWLHADTTKSTNLVLA